MSSSSALHALGGQEFVLIIPTASKLNVREFKLHTLITLI